MLTTKQFRPPVLARTWTAPKPKYVIQSIAVTALAIAIVPSATALISHQMQLQAAGGKSCLRVNAERTGQIRKYGSECNF